MSEDYERILTVKPEVLVYRIPPRPSNRGYRAADWGLDKPSWTGRMRITEKANKLTIKLEDKISGESFAQAPVDAFPGVAVESVTDSSRYFVLKIADGSGRTAFIGIGFADRGDAFDFNVTLQDFFKKDKQLTESISNQPALDLQLKEGQTFKINLSGKLGSKPQAKQKTCSLNTLGGMPVLPPPGGLARPPGGVARPHSTQVQQQQPALVDLALNVHSTQPNQSSNQFGTSDWGEFASAQPAAATKQDMDQGWVQF